MSSTRNGGRAAGFRLTVFLGLNSEELLKTGNMSPCVIYDGSYNVRSSSTSHDVDFGNPARPPSCFVHWDSGGSTAVGIRSKEAGFGEMLHSCKATRSQSGSFPGQDPGSSTYPRLGLVAVSHCCFKINTDRKERSLCTGLGPFSEMSVFGLAHHHPSSVGGIIRMDLRVEQETIRVSAV